MRTRVAKLKPIRRRIEFFSPKLHNGVIRFNVWSVALDDTHIQPVVAGRIISDCQVRHEERLNWRDLPSTIVSSRLGNIVNESKQANDGTTQRHKPPSDPA